MRKTFKYRIYANKETIAKAENWLELCRNLYNCALAERIYAWKMQHKYISCYAQQLELHDLKLNNFEYKLVSSQVLQGVLGRLDESFKVFFRQQSAHKKGGFPRFKGKNRYDSFTLKNTRWTLDRQYLFICNVGRFKLKLSRPIQGEIKTITIKRTPANKWYACFNCNNVPEHKLEPCDKTIGVDVGIKSYCVDSDGLATNNPKFLIKSLKLLKRKQRRLSRRVKPSQNRKESRILVAKTYERIANQRKDFLHKLVNYYINNYGNIYIEGLQINNMVKNHSLARFIADASWGKFFELLAYKAEEAGRKVIKVKPHNTSQICSECGEKVEKTLVERTHHCPYCGIILDRDENAARNILQVGQTCQELTYGNSQCVS
jgi:putative transposase